MEFVDWIKQLEIVCNAKQMFGVRVASDQFDYDFDEQTSSWKRFVDL
jgi:hypothetical protein